MNAAIITLGCRLNQAESALMTARLEKMGIRVIPYCPAQPPDPPGLRPLPGIGKIFLNQLPEKPLAEPFR